MLTSTIVDEAQRSEHYANYKTPASTFRILNPRKHKNVNPKKRQYAGFLQPMHMAEAPYFSERNHFPYIVPENTHKRKYGHKHANEGAVEHAHYTHPPEYTSSFFPFHPTGVSSESVADQPAPAHGNSSLTALQ